MNVWCCRTTDDGAGRAVFGAQVLEVVPMMLVVLVVFCTTGSTSCSSADSDY